ncbi:hypothetical protein HDU79_002521, partial [Rhizoclosmatium sp. JEL0117]
MAPVHYDIKIPPSYITLVLNTVLARPKKVRVKKEDNPDPDDSDQSDDSDSEDDGEPLADNLDEEAKIVKKDIGSKISTLQAYHDKMKRLNDLLQPFHKENLSCTYASNDKKVCRTHGHIFKANKLRLADEIKRGDTDRWNDFEALAEAYMKPDFLTKINYFNLHHSRLANGNGIELAKITCGNYQTGGRSKDLRMMSILDVGVSFAVCVEKSGRWATPGLTLPVIPRSDFRWDGTKTT